MSKLKANTNSCFHTFIRPNCNYKLLTGGQGKTHIHPLHLLSRKKSFKKLTLFSYNRRVFITVVNAVGTRLRSVLTVSVLSVVFFYKFSRDLTCVCVITVALYPLVYKNLIF